MDQMQQICEALLGIINAEYEVCVELKAKTAVMQECLVEDNLEKLTDVVEQQEMIFSKLAGMEEKRQMLVGAVCATSGQPANISAIEEIMLSNGIKQAHGISSRFTSLAGEIARTNSTNAVLVRDSLQKSRMVMDFIGRNNKTSVYNRSGRMAERATAMPSMINSRG